MRVRPGTAAAVLALVALIAGAVWLRSRATERRALPLEGALPPPAVGPALGPASLPEEAASGRRSVEASASAPEPSRALSEEPSGILSGRLSHRDDSPAGGVPLRLFGHSGGRSAAMTVSDADGRFRFQVASGRWQLGCSSPAPHPPWCREVELEPGEEEIIDHVFGEVHELCLKVWQRDGGALRPLEGAEVRFLLGAFEHLDQMSWREELDLPPILTDPEGTAQIAQGDQAAHALFIEKAGHQPALLRFDFAPYLSYSPFEEDGCIHVFLDRKGPRLSGTVLDPDGRPLGGAIVVASAPFLVQRFRLADFGALAEGDPAGDLQGLHTSEGVPWARTDGGGRFELLGPDPDAGPRRSFALVVYPERRGLVHHHVHPLDVLDVGRSFEVLIRVQRGFPVEIELLDEGGALLDGIASLRDPDGRAHAPVGRLALHELQDQSAGRLFATKNGRFTLIHPGGPARVGLSPRGFWDEREFELMIPPGARAPLRVVIPRL